MGKLMSFNLFGKGRSLRWAITITCQIAFIFFGYDQGVFSGIVTNTNWQDTFGNPSPSLEGSIVSIYNVGAFFGCGLAFLGGEKMGRRLSIWVSMGFIIVGAILQATSYSLAQIFIARFVTGLGTGIETSTVPMYQSELCDADKRGRLVSSEPLFVGVGIVIAYFFDFGMRYVGGEVAWRVPIACQIFFAVLTIVLVFGIPESPRWLYYHGRSEEALQVLCDVWGETAEGPKVKKMNAEIRDTIALEEKSGKFRWRDILKRDRVQTGRRIALAYGMQFMNQMGGINLVVYYVPTSLEDNVGLSPNIALAIGGCVQTMFFFGSLVPTFLLDKMGRRRPMMWGSAGLAFSMMMISVLLSFRFKRAEYSEATGKACAEASIAFFFVYMFIFGATANCIPWVYVPEILPLHARAKGTAVGISANWLWNFFVVMITPTLISALKWKAYFVFMATNIAFIPLVYFCYPETKNLSLEEIDYLFTKDGNTGLKKFGQRSQPVQESLKPIGEIEKDVERQNSAAGIGEAQYIEGKEGKDEKSSEEELKM